MREQLKPVAVILAGGVGSRFWPASTPRRPKQLLALSGDAPLITQTVTRAAETVGLENVRVLAGAGLARAVRKAVPELSGPQFLLEPRTRGTAPVLTWAAWQLEKERPGAVMISLHADHVIAPLEEFKKTVSRAVRAARERASLVCLGAEPDRPETGFGWIDVGPPGGDDVWEVRRFIEKPDRRTAEELLATGTFLWNTGIFVWRTDAFLQAVRRWTPELADALRSLEESGDADAFFDSVPSLSVDEGVLERADNVEVARATFTWDDVGSWNALARTRSADPDGNVIVGDALAIEARDNIVWSEEGRVVLFGVDDLVVVRSGEHVFVATRSATADLKNLVDRLNQE